MPLIRFLVFKYYTYTTILILLLDKVILTYSCYAVKKIVYIAIAALSNY
jgi:hypothetical protein